LVVYIGQNLLTCFTNLVQQFKRIYLRLTGLEMTCLPQLMRQSNLGLELNENRLGIINKN
jgi:hypothetical protein